MNAPVRADSREAAYGMPIERIDVSDPHLYQDDTWHPYFQRLRQEDPVHWCEDGMYGAYWSVTRYRDIMAVDTNHHAFSSDAMMGGIVVGTVLTLLFLPALYVAWFRIPRDEASEPSASKVV